MVSLQKRLPSAITIAWLATAPAFAADQSLPAWLPPLNESVTPGPVFGDQISALTGPPTFDRPSLWRGFYLGGQIAYSSATADFSNSTQAPIAYSLRETQVENQFAPSHWQVLGTASHGTTGFGGFIGYNAEFTGPYANVVLGWEANYEHTSLSLVAPNSPIARILPTGDIVSITGSGTLNDLDFGTLRARAGVAIGNFLPYGFAGFATGNTNIAIAETTTLVQKTPPGTFVFTGTAGKNSEWLYGYTVGAGVDFAVSKNLFLRGEYEYVQFHSIDGVALDLNTVRAGAAFKF